MRTASAALYAPMSGSDWSHDVRIAGRPEPGAGDDVSSAWTRVMPSFFETIGDRIVMGRPIVDADNATARRVAVINEAFAKKFFRDENPIGRHFGPAAGRNASLYEIDPFGVVVPRTEDDVVTIVRYAAEQGLSIHARVASMRRRTTRSSPR